MHPAHRRAGVGVGPARRAARPDTPAAAGLGARRLPGRRRPRRAPRASRQSASCGGCAAACSTPAAPTRSCPTACRCAPFAVGRRRGRAAARQQRRLRLAPRAGRLDARRRQLRARPSRGSTRTACCWPSTRRRRARPRLPLDQGARRGTGGRTPTARSARSTCSASTRPRAGRRLGPALTLAGLAHLRDRGLRARDALRRGRQRRRRPALPRPRLHAAGARTCRTGADRRPPASPWSSRSHDPTCRRSPRRPCSSSVHPTGSASTGPAYLRGSSGCPRTARQRRPTDQRRNRA